jgi:hypothetical protein
MWLHLKQLRLWPVSVFGLQLRGMLFFIYWNSHSFISELCKDYHENINDVIFLRGYIFFYVFANQFFGILESNNKLYCNDRMFLNFL